MKNEVIEKDTNLQNKLDLIKRTVAKGATNDEFQMFMHLAKSYQLDPINKEIWFIKYRDNKGEERTTITTSRDGYLAIANRNEHFEGMLSDVVHKNDEFEKMPDGGVKHKYGCKDRGEIIGAYALGYRNDRKFPIYVFAHLSEYKKNTNVWNQYTSAMILKVSEAMMLKRLFSISGLVTREEIDEGEIIDIGDNGQETEVITETEKVISPTNNDRPSEAQLLQTYGNVVCEDCGVRVYGFKCPKCKKELKDLHIEAKGFIHSHLLTKEDFGKTGKMTPALLPGKLTKQQAIDIYDWWIGSKEKLILGERKRREEAEGKIKPAKKGKLEVKDDNAPFPDEKDGAEDFINKEDMPD